MAFKRRPYERKLYFDLETRSRVNIKKSNAYRYVQDPDFQILMMAWAFDDEPVQISTDPEEIRELLPAIKNSAIEKIAHNEAFERICMSTLDGLPEGRYLNPRTWTDTAALAGVYGYPQGLAELAGWLGGEKKDEAGTRLINLFCVPNSTNRKASTGRTVPKGEFNQPEDFPEEWEEFKNYCVQDVVTLRDVEKSLPTWPTNTEYLINLCDARINDRGIKVDRELMELAEDAGDTNGMVQEVHLQSITGVRNPNSRVQMMSWMEANGLPLPNLQSETVEQWLKREDLTELQRDVLETRQELALVAAKKFEAARVRLGADDRLRGAFRYFGAHTGRWAGRGVQLQNLPRETVGGGKLEGEALDKAIAAEVLDLKLTGEAEPRTLKALVRNMFVGPFAVVDYSAIEARVLAWLAGEQWALDAFALGRDIYVETGQRMGGMNRQEGKVAVLALGYNGGIGSLKAMGAVGSDEKLQKLVTQWRNANLNIVQFWADLDFAFRSGGTAGRVRIERDGETRAVHLPSGRAIYYHGVKQRWITNAWGKRVREISFKDPRKPGVRVSTYGGKLSENVTQAVARDILGAALIRLARAGYPVVGHVHDEVLVDLDLLEHGVVAPGVDPLQDITEILVMDPGWAEGLPLNAEGFICPRYRKG